MSDGELANLATRTLGALATNTNFPNMDPPLADYQTSAEAYLTLHGISAKGGSTQQNRQKDEAKDALLVMMRRVASYINNFTDVSSTQLSSGFYPVDPPEQTGAPQPVEWIRFRDGRLPGELILDWAAAKGAKEYEYTIADQKDAGGEPVWGDIRRARRSKGVIVTGLTNRTEYYARVRSRNILGESVWSTVAIGFTRW